MALHENLPNLIISHDMSKGKSLAQKKFVLKNKIKQNNLFFSALWRENCYPKIRQFHQFNQQYCECNLAILSTLNNVLSILKWKYAKYLHEQFEFKTSRNNAILSSDQ